MPSKTLRVWCVTREYLLKYLGLEMNPRRARQAEARTTSGTAPTPTSPLQRGLSHCLCVVLPLPPAPLLPCSSAPLPRTLFSMKKLS